MTPELERPGPAELGCDIRAFCREHGLARQDAARALRYAEGLVTHGIAPETAERRAVDALRAVYDWVGPAAERRA